MKRMDILVQFHATVDEIAGFLEHIAAQTPFKVTAFRFPPFTATAAEGTSLEALVHDASVRELAITLEAPTLAVGSSHEFLLKNPNTLRLQIGRLSEGTLRQSCLSARTSDASVGEVWRKAAQYLRKITQAGAVAVNPATGATSILKGHRFTLEAKRLDSDGVIIKPVAGTAVLHLGRT